MIDIAIIKLESNSWRCRNPNCKKLSEYIAFEEDGFYIKAGTICVFISLYGLKETYCFDCIDDLYSEMRQKLDKRLWKFE